MILDQLDQRVSLSEFKYKKELIELQLKLRELALECYRKKVPVCVVFEGWDAAGKGGAIKRLTEKLDPRGYTVIPIKAPTDEEKAHHYLWRFWNKVPKQGKIVIFDRSWYGRVLVERVEGFCPEADWRRGYQEIRSFERQMADFGTVIVKHWIHITQKEQLRRFNERKKNPLKHWKLTEEDWRNRAKWPQYTAAVEDMLSQTSTPFAPWKLVAGNNKHHARLEVLRNVCEAVEQAVE